MPASSLPAWARRRVDQTYRTGNWAGPGVLRAIRAVPSAVAHWRPDPDQHTIAEMVRHMGYWKLAVEARLTGRPWAYDKVENWRPVAPTARGWVDAKAELADAHRRLMRALDRLSAADLAAPVQPVDPRKRRWSILDFVIDVATHDTYHAAQIFVLRRLAPKK
ncbi:MAG TPA: DinB family protein [bacterium]|jgi:uncharacterized damage-inducible protein DinB